MELSKGPTIWTFLERQKSTWAPSINLIIYIKFIDLFQLKKRFIFVIG